MSKPDNKPLEDAFSAGDMVDAPAPLAAVEAEPGPAPSPAPDAEPVAILDPPESKPLPNEKHERMLSLRLQGTSQYICFQRVIDNQADKKTATSGASEIFNRPEVRSRMAWMIEQSKKDTAKAINNDELRRIMAVIARSGCPNERIAASKQLRDWIKEDNQAQAAKSISDPAQVAWHLSGLARASAGWEAGQRVEFLQTCLGALDDLLHITPADWQAALAPDRAGAPPKTENSDFIGVSDPPKQATIGLPTEEQANS